MPSRTAKNRFQVFISHSSANLKAARQIEAALEVEGCGCQARPLDNPKPDPKALALHKLSGLCHEIRTDFFGS